MTGGAGCTTGAAMAEQAELWVDTPFVWQGAVRGKGADCKGLIAGIAAERGRPEAESLEALAADYSTAVDPRRLRAGLARLFDRVGDRRAGDVLLLRLRGKAQHLAIAAPRPGNPDRIIEAMPSGPGRVRPGRAGASRVDSIWRWRELDPPRPAAPLVEAGHSLRPTTPLHEAGDAR